MKKTLIIVALIAIVLAYASYRKSLIYDLGPTTAVGVSYQEIPQGLTSLKAETCGTCHQEIYAEWRTTMHAAAYTDPFFQAYWRKDEYEWSCLTCHTPLENQLKQRIVKFNDNDFGQPQFAANNRFDAELQQEGITCAACHIRDGIIYGPYPAEQLNAPHPVAYDERFLSEALCLDCHEVPAKPFSFLRSGICGTGGEWESGPYIKKGYKCQTCHMPEVTRPLVAGQKSRKNGRHLWRGGNSPEQVAKALTITAKRQEGTVRVDITNSGAGHNFPTGDPDREVFITAKLMNHEGTVLQTEELHIRRIIIWKPIMIELSDNRIKPLETRTLLFELPDRLNNQPLTVEVEGVYQILSERARNKLESHYGLKDYPPIRYSFVKKRFNAAALQ